MEGEPVSLTFSRSSQKCLVNGTQHPRRTVFLGYESKISIENEYRNELLQAVKTKDNDNIKLLVKDKQNIDIHDNETGATPQHVATSNNLPDILTLLLSHGSNCNVTDRHGQSPLHIAAKMGLSDCCKILIESLEVNVNMKNNVCEAPIHNAVMGGHIEICRLLLQHKRLDVNIVNKNGETPLMIAIQENYAEIGRILMESGAIWDVIDRKGFITIHYAAQKGYTDCCEVLLSFDEESKQLYRTRKDNRTALMLAASSGHHNCCKVLAVSNVNAKDREGNSALILAARGGFEKTVRVIIEKGGDIAQTNKRGRTALMEAASKMDHACLKLLIEHGAQIDVTDSSGMNIFHTASQKAAAGTLYYLLFQLDQTGIKKWLDKKESSGCSPLHLCIKTGTTECANLLLDAGVSPLLKANHGDSSLHLAAFHGKEKICERLISLPKVRLNSENDDKATPLHLASTNGFIDICQLLIKRGARLTALDKNSRTPLHMASLEGNVKVVKLLIQKGTPLLAEDDDGRTPLYLAAKKGSLDSCRLLVAGKQEAVWHQDFNSLLPLDAAFKHKHDDVFHFLIMMDHTFKTDDNLESRIHRYMHLAIAEGRIGVAEAIVESELWCAGFFGSCEGPCSNFRYLVKQFPILAEKVLDRCIEKHADNHSVTYNFRLYEDDYYIPSEKGEYQCPFHPVTGRVIPGAHEWSCDNSIPWNNNHPLTMMRLNHHLNLLQHPLTNEWLLYKWKSYIWRISFFILLLEIFMCACLTGYVWNSWNIPGILVAVNVYNHTTLRNLTKLTLCSYSSDSSEYQQIYDLTHPPQLTLWLNLLLIASLCVSVIFEIHKFYKLRSTYWNKYRLVRAGQLVLTFILIVPQPFDTCAAHYNIANDDIWEGGIIAHLLAWLHLINTLNQLPILTIFMPITRQFAATFCKVMFFIVTIITAFAVTFHLLIIHQPAFSSMPNAFIRIVAWFRGDMGFDFLFIQQEETYPLHYSTLVKCLFVIFNFIIVGFLANLIITQPEGITEKLRKRAELHLASGRVQLFFQTDIYFKYLRRFCAVSHYTKSKETWWQRFLSSLVIVDAKTLEKDSYHNEVNEETIQMNKIEEILREVKLLKQQMQCLNNAI